jgi:hypothetical protein
MAVIEVRLQSRRRDMALLMQKLQHVFPAPVLLMHGVERVSEHPDAASLALGAAELVVSALVIGAFIRSVRQKFRPSTHDAGHAHGHGIDWVDVFLSVMLVTEAVAHWRATAHWQRPTLLMAATMLILGLIHGRLSERNARRRALRIDDDGLTIGGRVFGRWTARWSEISAIEIDARTARVTTRSGRERRFNLSDIKNRHELVTALETARGRWIAERAGS